MRALHVVPSFYPAFVYGGPTQSTYNLCQALARHGCEVRVLTTDANGPGVLDVDTAREVALGERLSVRYCPRVRRESTSPALLAELPGYLRWADVVHLMAVYSFPTIPTLAACRLLGKPVIWSPKGMLQRWEGSTNRSLKDAWDQVCRVAAPARTVLHFSTKEEADESTARFGGFASAIIPNGVDVPAEVRHAPPGGPLRVVFLGRLHPIKAIENLIEAIARARVPATLTIAGSGDPAYERALADGIAARGLGDRARMIGAVSGDAKRRLFEDADVLVIPSFRESFSIVVVEALAHEVPVLAARGTPWRRLEEEGCGLWIDNDPDRLAEALERVSRMPLREMGERGRAWVAREFTWDRVAEETIALYRRVATGDDGGSARQAELPPQTPRKEP
jgi:glycosyltransferase involved in cell wall biosynthesis